MESPTWREEMLVVKNEDEEAYQDVALHVVQERGVEGVALFGVSDLERGDVGG